MNRPASLLVVLLLATGCTWLEKMKPGPAIGPIEAKRADDLTAYLNRQSELVSSIRYPDIRIEAHNGKERFTLNEGTLATSKPRNFALTGGRHIMSDIVNIGSNAGEFWMYTKVPEKTFVVCSHEDFRAGAAEKLPFPFDPEWVLQALGMGTYPADANYQVETDRRNREHTLSFNMTTPQGTTVRREVVFAADSAGDDRPQVKRHQITDNLRRRIATAEIKSVETIAVGENGAYAQVPTHVVLEWPQQNFRLEMRLKNPKVNEPFSEDELRSLFTRPSIPGVTPINLAEARFTPRGSTPSDLPPRPFRRK